jgi:hypothetical protein
MTAPPSAPAVAPTPSPATARTRVLATGPTREATPDAAAPGRLRRWRGLVAVCALLLAAATLLGWWQSQRTRGFLDPAGVDPGGSRALAQLLGDQGVEVVPVRSVAAVRAAVTGDGSDATVLVTVPAAVREGLVDDVAGTGADLVLVTPGPALDGWPGGLQPAGGGPAEVLAPRCDLPVAVRAGTARVGGQAFAGAGTGCYPSEVGTTLRLVTEPSGRRIVALGSPAVLTNERLDEDGNAALALGLLGADATLVWYRPLPEPGGQASVGDLVPGWVAPAVAMLGVAALLAALWRGRRLGPLVPEPLPVTVRASETVAGRGRLYRQVGDRRHTADALREAAAARLAHRLGLPPRTPLAHLAAVAAARSGRDPVAVRALLDPGVVPPDDAALVRLAQDLDDLERRLGTRAARR